MAQKMKWRLRNYKNEQKKLDKKMIGNFYKNEQKSEDQDVNNIVSPADYAFLKITRNWWTIYCFGNACQPIALSYEIYFICL